MLQNIAACSRIKHIKRETTHRAGEFDDIRNLTHRIKLVFSKVSCLNGTFSKVTE